MILKYIFRPVVRRQAPPSIWRSWSALEKSRWSRTSSTSACRGIPLINPVILLLAGLLLIEVRHLPAQAPGVPVIEERHETDRALLRVAKAMRDAGKLLSASEVLEQLDREVCTLKLPRTDRRRLKGRELWERGRKAHIRIGYLYTCEKCTRWHLKLAGGYAITRDGAVATCYHVVEPRDDMEEGYLIGATADGQLLPVTEVLAASELTDACIVKVSSDQTFAGLPFNPKVSPGDQAWCYSDPAGREGYFSQGIVNRFYRHQRRNRPAPIRMNVTTDWAPGSSGSAVLDSAGNAIGHVTGISAEDRNFNHDAGEGEESSESTVIVFHSAVRAADVLALIKTP